MKPAFRSLPLRLSSIILSTALLLVCASCATPGIPPRHVGVQSRMAGGYIDAAGIQKPCAWTASSFTDLSASLPEGNQGGVVNSLSLEGKDLVYSGTYINAAGEARYFSIAKASFSDLGADKSSHSLIGGKYAGQGVGSGLVGFYIDGKKLEAPCYWQNGQRVDLVVGAKGNKGGIARSMISSRGAALVTGFYYDGEFNQKPCYWDNAVFFDLAASLPEGARGGVVNAVVSLR